MTSLITLHDDGIRTVILLLAVPDAHSLSATCTAIRVLLDPPTLRELVCTSIPPSIATRLFNGAFPNLSPQSVYRDFALMVTSVLASPPPPLTDVAFCVSCTQWGVTLNWFECEASTTASDEINLTFPQRVVDTLSFHVASGAEVDNLWDHFKYEILVTDLRSGRSRRAAEFSSYCGGDYDKETGEDVGYFDACYMSVAGGFFTPGQHSDESPAMNGALFSTLRPVPAKTLKFRSPAQYPYGNALPAIFAFTGLKFCGYRNGDDLSFEDTLRLLDGLVEGTIIID